MKKLGLMVSGVLLATMLLVGINGCTVSEDRVVEVVPLPPSELKVTLVSGEQVDLSWKDNSTNETGYKIERKTDSGNFTEIGDLAPLATISVIAVVVNVGTLKVLNVTSFEYEIDFPT